MIRVNSKVVAEFLGKRHDNLMRTIKTDIKNLENPDRFYKPSTYQNERGKVVPCYEISMDGCGRLSKRLSEDDKVDFLNKCIGTSMESPETSPEAPEREYTVKEVADKLGISERTVRRRIERGEIKAEQKEYQQIIVSTRSVVKESVLKEYMRSQEDEDV